MRCKKSVSGVVAGAILLVPWLAAFSQAAESPSIIAQQDRPDATTVPDIADPPETRIPEQIYPCNPGGFEPSARLAKPDPPEFADDCEGVIAPPPSADAEIDVKPPEPNAGTLPIIKPHEIDPD